MHDIIKIWKVCTYTNTQSPGDAAYVLPQKTEPQQYLFVSRCLFPGRIPRLRRSQLPVPGPHEHVPSLDEWNCKKIEQKLV
jgi:hypothetical protein